MKRTMTLATGLLVAVAWTFGSGTAFATLEMQKKGKEAGFEIKDCTYCHNEKLPKKGASTDNDRGKWLKAEKDKRGAKAVDVTWLKDYQEKK